MLSYFRKNRLSILVSVSILLMAFTAISLSVRANRLVVDVNQLKVRTGPSMTYRAKKTLKRGQAIYIVSRKENWYRIRYNDQDFGWVASWLINRPTKLKTASRLSEATIILDPGHGGHDSGALTSDEKHQEKRYTLEMAKAVQKALKKRGANVIMTRDADQTVSLTKRPELAADNHADAFISFHFDSNPFNNSATGFTTYYYHEKTSLSLAESINRHLTGLGLPNRGVEVGDYQVVRDNLRPAVLLEMGYINTDSNFKLIASEKYQTAVANQVVDGLSAYFDNQ